MYTVKTVRIFDHYDNKYHKGILEQDPEDSYIGKDGWITPDIAVEDFPNEDAVREFVENYEGNQYDRYTLIDGVYHVDL